MRNLVYVSLFCVIFTVGCGHISKETKWRLDKEVDCQTAELDIEILEGEKASAAKRTLSGVRSVLPAAIVINILKGTYKDGIKVTTGQYNKDIDAKIQEIKDTCGIYD